MINSKKRRNAWKKGGRKEHDNDFCDRAVLWYYLNDFLSAFVSGEI